MSIFKKIGHTFKHVAKQAEHTAEDAGKAIGDVGKTGADAVSDAANQIGDTVANLNPAHIADEVKHEVLSAINSVKDQAISAIKTAEHEAEKGVKDLADKAIHEIEADIKKLEETLQSQTAKAVLKQLVNIVHALSPDDIQVQIGPILLDIGDVPDKVGALEHYAEHPPKKRSDYEAFIHTLAPNSVSIIASVGLGFIFQSDDLKVDITATWTADEVFKNIDGILDQAGIV